MKAVRIPSMSGIMIYVFLSASSLIYYSAVTTFAASVIDVEIGESYHVVVKDHAGSVISDEVYNKSGHYTYLMELPEYVYNAFVAVEDRDFYNHHGFDLARIIQAGAKNVTAGKIKEGGSTITQQLARMLYLDNDRSFFRKGHEALLALALEDRYDKKQILESYVNLVFLGHGLHGVDQASHFYFNKEPRNLTVAEAALLAGLCSIPNSVSEGEDYAEALTKQEIVLEKMYLQGYINAVEYNEALNQPLIFTFTTQTENNIGKDYYLDAIYQELDNLGLLDKKALVKGLVVETNINASIANIVSRQIKQHNIPSPIDVSVVIVEPYSGKITTLIGGKNYQRSQYNRAYAKRPIGSTIKPIIYYLGLQTGMRPESEFVSEPASYIVKNYGEFKLYNAGERYGYRPINMIEAIGTSDNVYAGKTTLLVGSANIASTIDYFRLDDDITPALPTLCFGNAELSPVELASIYNTFASEGEYYRPRLINKVYANGRLLYSVTPAGKQVFNRDNVITLTQMLTAPFDNNITQYGYTKPTLADYQTSNSWAAKTGSTQATSWVVGYNPLYTMVIYVGTDDNSDLALTTLSRRLFADISKELDKLMPDLWYAPTNRLKATKVNPVTLAPATNGSLYYFPKS